MSAEQPAGASSVPAPGKLAKDTKRDRVGQVMGTVGGRVHLRPVGGGVEWEAMPEHVRSLSRAEELSARLAAVNAGRRWGK